MLPIAVLPAAGILLRLGQDDLLGGIDTPVIGPFFDAMSAAGGAVFANLPLLFAVGVAIGFAKKADGSTALAAVVGYVVIAAVFKTMSPVVLAGQVDRPATRSRSTTASSPASWSAWSPPCLFDGTTRSSCRRISASSAAAGSCPIVVSLAACSSGSQWRTSTRSSTPG